MALAARESVQVLPNSKSEASMNIAILEERRAALARIIDRTKAGFHAHMRGENRTSAQTIRSFEQALVNLDCMIAAAKRKLS
jgi:hypothetical protein